MAKSALKALRGPRLSAKTVADLLEMLRGDGTNELLCSEALDALPRMRDKTVWKLARATVLLMPNDATVCQQVDAVVTLLRTAPDLPLPRLTKKPLPSHSP